MSRRPAKDKTRLALVLTVTETHEHEPEQLPADAIQEKEADEPGLFPLALNYASSGMADLERGALLRVFRDRFRGHVKYLMSARGGGQSFESAMADASANYDQREAVALMEELLSTPMESVEFDTLKRVWDCSPEEAERFFALMKNEA